MANIIEQVFTFVDSPRERPWVSMGALCIFIILGAAWVNQAQVLPGVSVSETGLDGSIVDIMWDDDGERALALVEDGNGQTLMTRSQNGDWQELDCNCNPTAIGGNDDIWVAGGDDGWFGVMNAGSNGIATRSINWPPGAAPDIISLDGDQSAGWMIVEHAAVRTVHTWLDLNVSEGASYPISDIVLDGIKEVTGGALVIGHDTASNPSLGITSEVLIDAERNSSGSPKLTLLHRGAGASFHTIISLDDSSNCIPNCLIAIVAGGDAIYGVTSDTTAGRNVHRIAGSIGVNTITMDGQDLLWFKSDNGLSTMMIGDLEPTIVKTPDGTPTDLSDAAMAGDNVVLYSDDGSTRITIDPTAQNSLLRSLSLLGDLILVLTFVAFAGFGGHALLRKHEVL